MKVYHLPKLLFLTFFLCSCGQTGPLYLPGTPPPIHTEKERPAQPDMQKTEPNHSTSSESH